MSGQLEMGIAPPSEQELRRLREAENLREAGIRPARRTRPAPSDLSPPFRLRPTWLAFILRNLDRIANRLARVR